MALNRVDGLLRMQSYLIFVENSSDLSSYHPLFVYHCGGAANEFAALEERIRQELGLPSDRCIEIYTARRGTIPRILCTSLPPNNESLYVTVK